MRKSLRRTLLLWLLGPMLTLFSIGTVVVYQLALNYSEAAYDRALSESAHDVLQVARQSFNGDGHLVLPRLARDILTYDQFDRTYFSILDERGRLVAGDAKLKPPPERVDQDSLPMYYDTMVAGREVRAIVTALETPEARPRHWRILVGETRHRRDTLAQDILTGFVVPQALIILLAAVLVMFGVKWGLSSLDSLRESLARRSHNDLRALDTPNVPIEVQPLMQEINSLLGRLESVFDSQKRFIADAAHQLRTPLAGLSAQIDVARSQDNPPATQHALEQMKLVSSRLNQAIQQLLTLARNEAVAERPLNLGPLDLAHFARLITADWVTRAMERSIDLGFEGAEGDVMVSGDALLLREMLDNLLDNALRYCPRGSRVTVRVTQDADLCVEDDGPGIPPEERQRVFERFHRLLGNDMPGNGLGLAIVKDIVALHGASVQIEAGPNGRGTLFRVRFPH